MKTIVSTSDDFAVLQCTECPRSSLQLSVLGIEMPEGETFGDVTEKREMMTAVQLWIAEITSRFKPRIDDKVSDSPDPSQTHVSTGITRGCSPIDHPDFIIKGQDKAWIRLMCYVEM